MHTAESRAVRQKPAQHGKATTRPLKSKKPNTYKNHYALTLSTIGNLLQCSCLENPMDRGAWRATVHRVTESQTRLKRLSMTQHLAL